MKAWEEFSKFQKWVTAISATLASVVAIGAFAFSGYDHFATKSYTDAGDNRVETTLIAADQEAAEELHHVEQNLMVSANRAEIWRAKREIKRLQRNRVQEGLTVTDIMLIDSDIAEYKDLIDCIRDGKELCY